MENNFIEKIKIAELDPSKTYFLQISGAHIPVEQLQAAYKHLKEEFPDLPCIKEVISSTSDTMSAYNSCKSLYTTLDENFSKVIYNPKKSYNIQVLIASRQIDKILEPFNEFNLVEVPAEKVVNKAKAALNKF
jgi:hypothetical protein